MYVMVMYVLDGDEQCFLKIIVYWMVMYVIVMYVLDGDVCNGDEQCFLKIILYWMVMYVMVMYVLDGDVYINAVQAFLCPFNTIIIIILVIKEVGNARLGESNLH